MGAARAAAEPRYRAEKNRSVPRKIGSHLVLFDCINCDKCIPVCPNDANFVYETAPLTVGYERFVVRGRAVTTVGGGWFVASKAHQIANFQDFCNECGNCDVFCPEDGGPLHREAAASSGPWRPGRRSASATGSSRGGAATAHAVWARIRGREYRLDVDGTRDRGLFTDGVITVEVSHRERRPLAADAPEGAPEGHALDFSAYLNMALVGDGVLDLRARQPRERARRPQEAAAERSRVLVTRSRGML